MRPALLTASVLGAALIACTSKSTRVVVAVDAVDRTGAAPPAEFFRKEALADRLRAELEQIPRVEVRSARSDEARHQARLNLHVVAEQPAADDRIRRTVGLGIEFWRLGGDERSEVGGLAHVEGRKADGFGPAFEQALQKALARLATSLTLEDGPAKDVVAAIGSDDEFRRRTGIRLAGRRGLEAAIPALAALIRDEATPTPVALDAVGALVQIGSPAGAPAIIDAARGRPPEFLPQLLHALGAVGGRQAQGYLFTVQQGHPSEAIRAEAREALRVLEANRTR